MTITAVFIGLALRPQVVDKPSLQYYQQTFVIRQQDSVLRVPFVAPKPKLPLFLAFRKNDTYAVWDDRGLTIRRRTHVTTSKLADVIVSRKVFSKEEINRNASLIKDGAHSKEANAISGARRIGKEVYFLVRWDDKSGKAWAETLVSVDITSKKPTLDLLGRFEGLSFGTKPIDDKLQIVGGKLAIVSKGAESWGFSMYDPANRQFEYRPMGYKLNSFEHINSVQGVFTETSTYGTNIAGRIDLNTGTRKIFYEGREDLRFLDVLEPFVVIATEGTTTKIVNCTNAFSRVLPFVLDGRRAGANVLFWTPTPNPKAAWLLNPQNWEPEARWRSN